MKALGDYIHARNGTFGLYTAESPRTCGGYPASANDERVDADTFARWGVDYLKVKPVQILCACARAHTRTHANTERGRGGESTHHKQTER